MAARRSTSPRRTLRSSRTSTRSPKPWAPSAFACAGCPALDRVCAGPGLALVDEFPRLLVFRTFSKAWGLAGLRVGYWRSVSHLLNAFANESFIDEIAFATKQDPLVLRRKFDPEECLSEIARHRCDSLVVVPVMLRRILGSTFSALVLVSSSFSPSL